MPKISALDSSNSKELLGIFVSELFLSVAEQERREIRCRRQAERTAAAKACGINRPAFSRLAKRMEKAEDGSP
ncbi:MAG: hypothetical protein HFF84_15100 [Oscillibacter sp.]|nr:hypothetical protein [Oscillibacter sp.]